MAIFCTSCGTLYGGWEFCPECNADNPYLDKKDQQDRLKELQNRLSDEYISARYKEIFGPLYSSPEQEKTEDPAHKPVEHHDSGAGENSGEYGANVPTFDVLPYFSGESKKC
jgi:hypothetical protein